MKCPVRGKNSPPCNDGLSCGAASRTVSADQKSTGTACCCMRVRKASRAWRDSGRSNTSNEPSSWNSSLRPIEPSSRCQAPRLPSFNVRMPATLR
ncbi:hypothetical protein D3C75_1024630 [compost metagenome]